MTACWQAPIVTHGGLSRRCHEAISASLRSAQAQPCGPGTGRSASSRSRRLGEQPVLVVDLEAVAVGGDGDGEAGVAEADVDALPGDHDGAAAADPTLHRGRGVGDVGWRAGGSTVAEAWPVVGA